MKQSVQVTILGQQFHLKSDASAEQVHRVAAFVEAEIARVTSGGHVVDSLQAAILALLNVSAAYLQSDALPKDVPGSTERLDRLSDRIERALADDRP